MQKKRFESVGAVAHTPGIINKIKNDKNITNKASLLQK